MDFNESEGLNMELQQLAEQWSEAKYESAQATHVFSHPAAREFGKRPEAIPFMLKKLSSDITWVVPLEGALREMNVDLSKKINKHLVAKPVDNQLQDKLSHLEGNRQAILAWAKEKGLSL